MNGGTFFTPNGRKRPGLRPRRTAAEEARAKARAERRRRRRRQSAADDAPAAHAAGGPPGPGGAQLPQVRARRPSQAKKKHAPGAAVAQLQMSEAKKVKDTGKDSDRGGKLDPYLSAYCTVPAPSPYKYNANERERRGRKQWLADMLTADGGGEPSPSPGAPHMQWPASPHTPRPAAAAVMAAHFLRDAAAAGRAQLRPLRGASPPPDAPVPVGDGLSALAKEDPLLLAAAQRRAPIAALRGDLSGLSQQLREVAQRQMEVMESQRPQSPAAILGSDYIDRRLGGGHRVTPSHRARRSPPHGRVWSRPATVEPEQDPSPALGARCQSSMHVQVKCRKGRSVAEPQPRACALKWGREVRTADEEEFSDWTDSEEEGAEQSRPAESVPYEKLLRDGVFHHPTPVSGWFRDGSAAAAAGHLPAWDSRMEGRSGGAVAAARHAAHPLAAVRGLHG